MKRFAALVLPVLLLACGSPAAKPAATTPAPVAGLALPLLWEAKGPTGSVWLYGTIHTGGEKLVPAAAWDQLGKSKRFVMETDLESIDQNELMARGLYADGQSLDQVIKPEAWKVLVARVGHMVPENVLKKFKPWLAMLMVVQTMLPGGEAPDVLLLRKARALGLELAYLEPWTDQIDALEATTDAASLEQTLAEIDTGKKVLDQMVEAYAAGDIDTLNTLINDPSQWATPQARDKLLIDRNRRWLPQIETFAASSDTFIAVGAGHIIGKDGLIELLTADGYVVTRAAAK
jgi:uncharacterized protein YbaP (TraB family)